MQESIDRGIGISNERIAVNEHVRQNIESAARWGKLVALGGFFLSGFIFIMSLIWMKMAFSASPRRIFLTGSVIGFFFAVILFFPGLHLQRFCTNVLEALKNDDQADFEVGVDYLKILLRTLGLYSLVLIAVLLLLGGWYIYLQLRDL